MRIEKLCLISIVFVLLSPLGARAFQLISPQLFTRPRKWLQWRIPNVKFLKASAGDQPDCEIDALHEAVCKAVKWEKGKSLSDSLVAGLQAVDVQETALAGESILLSRPLTKYLATQLLAIESFGTWLSLPALRGLVEVNEDAEKEVWYSAVSEQLQAWRERKHDSLGKFAFYGDAPIRDLVISLGPRGVLCALGMRKTAGSVLAVPPTTTQLLDSFNENHAKGGKSVPLTVGARALAKHAIRSSDGFWGQATGGDKVKNSLAEEKCRELIEQASWINIHGLADRGEEQQVLEIRLKEGYGARWAISEDRLVFRGFLEPMMEDGHSVGWRH